MAGKGTISVNQTPQYGDKTAIENLKKQLTTTPMTGVPTPARGAGRPPSANVPTAQTAPVESRVSPEHQQMMNSFAQAFRTNQFWQSVLAKYPSQWSRIYAKEAEREYQQKLIELRNSTPFFE